jgi:hypothetical protein
VVFLFVAWLGFSAVAGLNCYWLYGAYVFMFATDNKKGATGAFNS